MEGVGWKTVEVLPKEEGRLQKKEVSVGITGHQLWLRPFCVYLHYVSFDSSALTE